MRRRNSPGDINIWPAFTDVLGSMLVVLVFLITVFVINEVLIGREMSSKETVIDQLQGMADYLDNLLGEANSEKEALRDRIAALESDLAAQRSTLSRVRDELAAASAERERLQTTLNRSETERNRVVADLADSRSAGERLQAALNSAEADNLALQVRLHDREQAYARLEGAKSASDAELALVQEQAALLSARTERLVAELERLNDALAGTEQRLAQRHQDLDAAQRRIADLQQHLAERDARLARNAATIGEQKLRIAEMDALIKKRLVERVEELEKYKSDFFGRLREVFADNPDIKVEGDRFVFQSEVLFPSGSADLSDPGKLGLDQFVDVYRQVEKQIPPDLPVIIEVQGHTDKVPIKTSRYESNWELSAARALNVVDHLIAEGIPPERLAAVGMGEYHPIDDGSGPAAWRRNRRIELKITSR